MIQMQGFKELDAVLSRMKAEAIPIFQKHLGIAGSKIHRKIQSLAPGDLKNGMEYKLSAVDKGYISGEITFKKGYQYGVPVELGHHLVAWGHPTGKVLEGKSFMRRGADEAEEEFVNDMEAAMDELLGEW